MRKTTATIVLSLLILALLAGGGSAAPIQDVATPAQGDTVSIEASAEQTQASAMIWTREARAATKAFPSPVLDAAQLAALEQALQAETADVTLTPGFAPGSAGVPGAERQAMQAYPEEWALADLSATDLVEDSSLEPTGTSNVYTTYLGNYDSRLWKTFPYKAVGKLYFNTASGGSGYCSASVISSKNIIVTAAHCLYDTDTNRWHSNWVFVPAERNSAAPYGTFAWKSARVLTAYINASTWSNAIRYDVGVMTLKPNSSGRVVMSYTGYLGRSWNYGYVQNLTEIGYPSNLTSGGKNGRYYTFVNHAESYYGSGTDLLRWGSNMGFGASGSPLLRVFAPYQSGAINYVNAVQSGSSPNGTSPTSNIAPRFSSYNIVPLCNAEGC